MSTQSELTVEEWFDELRYGLEYRQQYAQEREWSRIEQMFYNGHTSSRGSGSNIIYSTGDAFLSTVHTPNPYALAEPSKPQEADWAPFVEQMDNQLLCETKAKREMHSAGLYAYLWGTSFLKIGYDSEFGWDPTFDVGGSKQPIGVSLTRIGKDQNLNEFSDNQPGMPWVKSCLPHDIVVPWGTRDLDSALWIAHRIVRHIDDIKSDPKYSQKRDLGPSMSMKDFVGSYDTMNKPYRIGPDLLTSVGDSTGEAEFVELWEIHDKRRHKIFVIATNYKKFLRNEINHLQIKGLPFVELGFVPKGRTIWRTSDAMFLVNHQAELTDITLQARKQRRLNILKWIVEEGMFDDAELNKLMSKNVGAVAVAKRGSNALGNRIMNAPISGANDLLYREAEDVRSSARETVGFDRNSFGEYKGARTTATEVQAVQQSKDNRMNRRQDAVGDAYVELIEKMNAIVYRFWTTPRVAQILGPLGAMMWQQYVPAEIQGNYNIKIIFDNPGSDSVQSRQQQAIQAYQLSLQDPSFDPMKVRQNLVRSFPNASIANLLGAGGIPQMGQNPNGPPASGVQPSGGRGPRLAG